MEAVAAVAVAFIAAVPATIAASAGWLRSRRIDRAVNGQPADAPTLYNLVERIDGKVDRHLAWHAEEPPRAPGGT